MTHNLRHKEHIDKKEKLEAGSVTTKASTHDYYARKMHATEDHPGSIEEGKIFFFYRPASLLCLSGETSDLPLNVWTDL